MTDTPTLIEAPDEIALLRGIAPHLARAQANFPELTKSRTAVVPTKAGGEYRYDYADLGDALKAVRPMLAAEGICVSQPIQTLGDGSIVIETLLVHADGMLRSSMPLPSGGGPQQVGSVLTYYRRYALCAAVGIAAEDDDDAAAAKGTVHDQPRQKARASRPRSTQDPPPQQLPEDQQRAERLSSMAAWADAIADTEQGAAWAAWKAEHPKWHLPSSTALFDDAYLMLRDLSSAASAAAGDEPFGEASAPEDSAPQSRDENWKPAEDGPAADDVPAPALATRAMVTKLQLACNAIGKQDRAVRLEWATFVLGRDIASFNQLTRDEASFLIDEAEGLAAPDDPEPEA